VKSTLACATALLLLSCREPAGEKRAKPKAAADPSAFSQVLIRDWPDSELHAGGRVTGTLASGAAHRYRIRLSKDDLLRLVVDQQGIDVKMALEDSTGARVLKRIDRQIGNRGPELVLAVAKRTGDYTLVIQGLEDSGRYTARIEALRPAAKADRRNADAYESFIAAQGSNTEAATVEWKKALATWRELGEVALEAEALERLATYHRIQGREQGDQDESRRAVDLYLKAAAAFARAGDRRWEAMVRTTAGSMLINFWEVERALEQFERALRLTEKEDDPLTRAAAYHGRGQARQRQGYLQLALDDYSQALKLWPEDEPGLAAATLHQLGVLYARFFRDEDRGWKLLRQALDFWGPEQRSEKAITASQLGRLAYERGAQKKARQLFEQALQLQSKPDQNKNTSCASAIVLARLALVEQAQQAPRAAEKRKAEALEIVGTQACSHSQSEATVHLLAADLAEKRRDPAAAKEGYQRCRELFDHLGDRMGKAECLAGLARSEVSLGHLPEARMANQRVLDIIEGVRPTVLSEDLRISFFSGAQEAFDVQIDLLLKLGETEEAWATAEAARARVLQDLLAESGHDLRRDAASDLIQQERELQRQLNVLESQRLDADENRFEELRHKIDVLIGKLERLRGEIRRASPFIWTEPVAFAATRKQLDDDTVVLEYHLGEKASTVWVVTRNKLTALPLAPRREIEKVAREAANWMENSGWKVGDNPPVLCDLSEMLLKPVAAYLGRSRLAVVADGALEEISFAALPDPTDRNCSQAPPLVDAHEIVSLPSVATLLTQRRLLAHRRPAPKTLAIVADPAYGPERLPLPGTAQEAREIAALLPSDQVFVAAGTDASLQTVHQGELQDYRILHIGAHGTFDPDQPLLSALVLAERDPAGRKVKGNLYAHEIYNLDLPAELVVLAACHTAGGREVPGEGLVSGLPRAFLYAGAARVLVSLWPVDDKSTRALMVAFYRALLIHRLPARALQEAQRALRQAGHAPAEWAGFVLVGDWRPLPPFPR
jgi:CHAT domain-containing protein/tetratricopeptide (TPR) repeat protein